MGAHVSRDDFEWTYTEVVHATRRREILKKHPEIKKLYGHDPMFKWIVTGMVITQFLMFYVIRNQTWPIVIFLGYSFGGTINHSLSISIHEIGHDLAFGISRPLANKFFGMFTNLPIGFPFSIAFKIYHKDHHVYQAVDKMDPDLPTYLEAKLFCTTFGKFVWVLLQPLFYAIRPLLTSPKTPTNLQLINIAVQLTFDLVVWHLCGAKSVVYMMGGTLLAMGLHPMAGHFISEHYMFRKGFETYSYYGCLNFITFNVGYHNEHHDFPYVPFSRLPEVRRIAAEFYDPLPQHHSWVAVLYEFITDPDIGPYARIKRKQKGLSS